MSQREIAEVVLPSGILKGHEVTELFQIFSKVPSSTSMFCKRGRKTPKAELYSPNRFRSVQLHSGMEYSGSFIDALDFAVTTVIILRGVQLFGHRGATYDIILEILKNDQIVSWLSSSYGSGLVNERYYGFNVELDKPVSLEPKVWYTVKAAIKGPISQFGSHGQTSVNVSDDLIIRYKNSNKCTAYTSVNEGQFPSFLLLY